MNDAGDVAFGMQWQGDQHVETLVGFHRLGSPLQLMTAPQKQVRHLNHYVGSVAFASAGNTVVATSPRGNVVQFFDVSAQDHVQTIRFSEACGLAANTAGCLISSGTGELRQVDHGCTAKSQKYDLAWDNHLVAIGRPSARLEACH